MVVVTLWESPAEILRFVFFGYGTLYLTACLIDIRDHGNPEGVMSFRAFCDYACKRLTVSHWEVKRVANA